MGEADFKKKLIRISQRGALSLDDPFMGELVYFRQFLWISVKNLSTKGQHEEG
jgi:hypothetical protein